MYWNPANKATGDYTIKATFSEPQDMDLNHYHLYGIVIGGNDLGTPNESYIYCSDWQRHVHRAPVGPAAFQVSTRRPEANAAINKAAGPKTAVTQEIAFSVKGYKIECSFNGTVVGSYDKAAVVAAGKLKSTDGVYGLRFGHNTEVVVTGLTLVK